MISGSVVTDRRVGGGGFSKMSTIILNNLSVTGNSDICLVRST
jgi:hypothetical protein